MNKNYSCCKLKIELPKILNKQKGEKENVQNISDLRERKETMKKMISGSFKNVFRIDLIYMYKKHLVINDQQLLCHKTRPNQTKPN